MYRKHALQSEPRINSNIVFILLLIAGITSVCMTIFIAKSKDSSIAMRISVIVVWIIGVLANAFLANVAASLSEAFTFEKVLAGYIIISIFSLITLGTLLASSLQVIDDRNNNKGAINLVLPIIGLLFWWTIASFLMPSDEEQAGTLYYTNRRSPEFYLVLEPKYDVEKHGPLQLNNKDPENRGVIAVGSSAQGTVLCFAALPQWENKMFDKDFIVSIPVVLRKENETQDQALSRARRRTLL